MFTLYSADYINAPGNCSYPHKTEVVDTADLAAAVSRDYVCAEYMNHYRNGEIADLLKLSRNAADSRLFRAKNSLRKMLSEL